MTKSEKEIQDQLDMANTWTSAELTECASMSYEQGVAYALEWVLGLGEDSITPIENAFFAEIESEKGNEN